MSRLYSFARKGVATHAVRGGFTLTEILVVILIIGILAAVAVPLYQKAVATTRFSGLMPVAKSIKTGEEAYWMANGGYSSDLTKLDIELPNLTLDDNDFYHYGDGQNITVNVDSTHENVRMTDDRVDNVRYVAYFDKSANFPGETHCEALTSDPNAKQICENLGTTELGAKGSYTTYLITGAGMGTLTDAPARLVSDHEKCVNNTNTDCVRKQYDDGSYTESSNSKICSYASNGNTLRCTTYSSYYITSIEYDPETGNKIKEVGFLDYRDGGSNRFNRLYEYDPETGRLVKKTERSGAYVYVTEYDEQGRMTRQTQYFGTGNWYDGTTTYQYDDETGQLVEKVTYDTNGKVSSFTNYDPDTGNPILGVSLDSNGNVRSYTEYDPETGNATVKYSVDNKGNITEYTETDPSQWWKNTFDLDYRAYYYGASAGTLSSASGYDENDHQYRYDYDANGNLTSAYGYDSEGHYFNVQYDSNGNITSYSENLGDGTISYNADGSVKSKNISQSESTDSYDLYSSTSYSYNNDGSYSVNTYYSYDNWDTGESEYRDSTNYYTSDGTFAGSYDENTGNEYRYTDGHLSSVSTDWGDGDSYTFYPDGSIKSASTNWGDTYIEYNQDGSINYDNSYDWYDENVSGYPQSSWGVSISDYPSYDSWGASNDTHTQSSWGTTDTSSWKQQDDLPSTSDWPSQNSLSIPDYTTPGTYTADDNEKNHSWTSNLEPRYCEYYPDDERCN